MKTLRLVKSGGVTGMKHPPVEMTEEAATARVPDFEKRLAELSARGVLGSKSPLWADAQTVVIEINTDGRRARYEIEESTAAPEALQLVDELTRDVLEGT